MCAMPHTCHSTTTEPALPQRCEVLVLQVARSAVPKCQDCEILTECIIIMVLLYGTFNWSTKYSYRKKREKSRQSAGFGVRKIKRTRFITVFYLLFSAIYCNHEYEHSYKELHI